MALAVNFSVPTSVYSHIRLTSQVFIPSVKSIRAKVPHSVQCNGGSTKNSNEKILRRSANYQPSIWSYDYVQSLSSKYVGDTYVTQATKLKEDVRKIVNKVVDPSDGLEMIDDLQRLGVFYHFEDEINRILESIYNKTHDKNEDDLHATSLKLRLLRQHGYNVDQEVFDKFLNEKGHFKASLCEDIRGMLQLYEASFLSFSHESILEEAQDFATKNLKQHLKRKDIDQDLALLISHALELPLHWRMPRTEARWFIEFSGRRLNMNPTLLQLAKLDFNMVQAIHQEEFKRLSRWWNGTGLGKKLSFGRDRLMEQFLWTVEANFKPQFSYFRKDITMAWVMGTPLDDVYDVHGTLDELKAFTNAVERWDIGAMEQLPDYMKICFLALFNLINGIGYDILKEQDVYIIPHIQKSWADLCQAFLKGAKWHDSGYTPTLEEYIDNGCISIGAGITLMHASYCINSNKMDDLDWLIKCPNTIRSLGTIARFTNDLATSAHEMERGDAPTSIQCYMHETGVSEKDARDHIKYLIGKTWKKMNEDKFTDASSHQTLVEIAMNFARAAMCIYQHGDGNGAQDPETIERVLSTLINPVPLEC